MRMRYGVIAAAAFVWSAIAAGDGAEKDSLRFSHKLHLQDVGAECMDCHAGAQQSQSQGGPRHAKMETCRTCHEDALEEKRCAMCHTNVEMPGGTRTALKHPGFSHTAHMNRDVGCVVCHPNVGGAERLTDSLLPDMSACFTCHNDKQASKNCGTCHSETRDILPDSHRFPGFKEKGHGSSARYRRQECSQCHQERFCDRCHSGQFSKEVHPAGFRYTHGFDARRRTKECRSCHEPERFCARCHEGKR